MKPGKSSHAKRFFWASKNILFASVCSPVRGGASAQAAGALAIQQGMLAIQQMDKIRVAGFANERGADREDRSACLAECLGRKTNFIMLLVVTCCRQGSIRIVIAISDAQHQPA